MITATTMSSVHLTAESEITVAAPQDTLIGTYLINIDHGALHLFMDHRKLAELQALLEGFLRQDDDQPNTTFGDATARLTRSIKAFHHRFDCVYGESKDRMALVIEECLEYMQEVNQGDHKRELEELADVAYAALANLELAGEDGIQALLAVAGKNAGKTLKSHRRNPQTGKVEHRPNPVTVEIHNGNDADTHPHPSANSRMPETLQEVLLRTTLHIPTALCVQNCENPAECEASYKLRLQVCDAISMAAGGSG